MGVEILGADVTPMQLETNEGNTNFPIEMNGKSLPNLVQEINEPTKIAPVDSLNGKNADAKDAKEVNNLDGSNMHKNAADEWPEEKKIHSFYFVRVRPSEDQQLKAKIAEADEKLQKIHNNRFDIINKLKEKRTIRSELKSGLQPYLAENRKHWTILEEKIKEIKPLRDDLQKHRTETNAARERSMGLCSSEEELNDLIQSLHYRIQHESNTLNEEKQLLKEIKQLEATREKVIANSAMKAEIENKKGQKAETQDRMKLLSVNMDEVRREKDAVVAQIKEIDEKLKIVDNEIAVLEETLRIETERKDNAKEKLDALRRSRDEVNACFYQNRSLLNIAKDLAAKKDVVGLEALCNSEVGKFMTRWSSDRAFRDDYERRILVSLDNRQLSRDGRIRNPNEKRIVVEPAPATRSERPASGVILSQEKDVNKLPSSSENIVSSSRTHGDELKKSTNVDTGKKTSNKEVIGKVGEDEPSLEFTKPKEKEIDPAKLKELKREEEIAKAKLAMERKKKLAEKAAAKAAARAEKEAEKKLKQKEKKAKKKGGTTEAALSPEQAETEPNTAEPEEPEKILEKPVSEVKERKVNPRVHQQLPRGGSKVQQQLPRVILKRKKSRSYEKWVVPGAILAMVLVAVAGYYYSTRV